jgi:hypothetical protein
MAWLFPHPVFWVGLTVIMADRELSGASIVQPKEIIYVNDDIGRASEHRQVDPDT